MHYMNAGAASMAQFINRLQSDQTTVIFGPDCLIDARVKAGLDPTLPETTQQSLPPRAQPKPPQPNPASLP
jgi:hypothetical protein